MRFEFAGVQYKIGFLHSQDRVGRRETLCFIDIAQNDTGFTDDRPPLGEGGTICAPSDRFCRETGRKVSLTRALSSIELPLGTREFRRAAWQAYLNRAANA